MTTTAFLVTPTFQSILGRLECRVWGLFVSILEEFASFALHTPLFWFWCSLFFSFAFRSDMVPGHDRVWISIF
jgi:hypothetical protein